MKVRRAPCECWFCLNRKLGCLVVAGIAVVVVTAALVILKYVS